MREKEQLEERLKWLKEARRINEDRHTCFSNDFQKCFHEDVMPSEYQALCDVEDEELEQHIERIERDLKHIERGEFR